MDRLNMLLAAWLLSVGALAEEGSPSTRHSDPSKDPNPGVPPFPDPAFANIRLNHSQAQRIIELDRRYDEEFQSIGTKDKNDSRFRDLWNRRNQEIRIILSAVQYERWKRLIADAWNRLRGR